MHRPWLQVNISVIAVLVTILVHDDQTENNVRCSLTQYHECVVSGSWHAGRMFDACHIYHPAKY